MGSGSGAPAGRLLDVGLVARLVCTAGLDCQTDGTAETGVLIRAGRGPRYPRNHAPDPAIPQRWTSRLSVGPAGELYVGPDDDRETVAVRVVGTNERQVAALIIAQALARDPGRPLSLDEIATLGLARGG